MAYNALNNLIDAYIYANGVQAITGQILNGVLKQMVSQLGSGYHLMGVATPQTVPATDDYAMAYFAATAGEYTDFGGITLAAGEVAVLLTSGNGSWSKQTIYNVPTGTADLENTAGFITNAVTDLVNYYTKTEIDALPNGEDIDFDGNDKLQFANRVYNAQQPNGMGYVILRKDKTFAAQVTATNTIYEVRYKFDLGGVSVSIPAGCVLKFNGGSINNGTIDIGTRVRILGNGEEMDGLFVKYTGNVDDVVIDGIKFHGTKVDSSSAVAGDLTTCIASVNYRRANNIRISNCVIYNYNRGISVCGENVTISDNLLYGNGSTNNPSGNVHDAEVDIFFAGQYTTEVDYKNNIIRNNRCLSQNVHRNIDAGENYWTSNIIIDGNICVSCDNSFNEVVRARKSQCILVGYAGSSQREKQVIITNNICKNCGWAGIYVRANNQEETVNTRKYVALISNNIVENVYRSGVNDLCAGIAVELNEGSEICNNYIANVLDDFSSSPIGYAINIGFVYSTGHTYVHDNTIKNFIKGILNDSYSRRVDICRNRLFNGSIGIVISDATLSGVSELSGDDLINIDGNLIRDCSIYGIQVFACYAKNIHVVNNTIFGQSKEYGTAGIYLNERFTTYFPIIVEHNNLSLLSKGIQLHSIGYLRNEEIKTFINFNHYRSCGQAMSVEVNSRFQLFITEGNTYDDCDSQFGDQSWSKCVYNGRIMPNGTYEILDDGGRGDISNTAYGYVTDAPACFYDKKFKKGDRVVTTKPRFFDVAVCSADYSDHSDSGAKWYLTNGRLSTTQAAIGAVTGGVVYDTTLKKMKCYNGTAWVNMDGTALS